MRLHITFVATVFVASLLLAHTPQCSRAGELTAPPAEGAARQQPPSKFDVMHQLMDDSDATLAVKKFDPEWVASLTDRGDPVVYSRSDSEDFEYIGMPIGGICAGQLYLGGDGKLWCWDIFNTKQMGHTRSIHSHRDPYHRSLVDEPAHHQLNQGFAIRLAKGDGVVTHSLDRDGFDDITFHGQYPIAEVAYSDDAIPVTVKLEAYSPFIPLDLENSTYPATVLNYRIQNTSDRAVEGELIGWLENAVCIQSRSSMRCALENSIARKDGVTTLALSADRLASPPQDEPLREEIVFEDFEGSLEDWAVDGEAFANGTRPNFHQAELANYEGKGLADSFRNDGRPSSRATASDNFTGSLLSEEFVINRKAIRFLIGGGQHPKQTCLNLIVDGKIVRTATGRNSEELTSRVFDVAEFEGQPARLEIVDDHRGEWGHVLVDQIVLSDNTHVKMPPLHRLLDYGSMALAVLGDQAETIASASCDPRATSIPQTDSVTTSSDDVPVGCVGRRFRLEPGESREVQFVLAWHFANAPSFPMSTPGGREYGERFASATEVVDQIANNFTELTRQTRLWRDTWYDSTLPHWFLDRTFINTSILATNTCYLFSDGRFYGYEGVYHGHGTCNHVWGYVQAPGRLFPEIERRLREQVDYKPGVGFDPLSGRIFHRSEANRSEAVDGQSGCILRTLLTHQMQPDDGFLKRVYSPATSAMNFLVSTYDADRDGILTGGQHNTLDAKWYGKITWLSLHYQAALRATAEMADEMGDASYAQECRELADRGRSYIENELFNGEYFFHEADPEHPESPGVYEGLEYSQLLGQSWAYQVGLGSIVDPAKAATHLRSLWKYNFTTDVGPFRDKYENGRWYAMPGEGGIIACTWPRGGDEALQLGHVHFAGYLNECQPGYEWAATSLMMWHDMPYHALAHTRTMHDRYHAAKRNPYNEVEWGDHYSRSMASYGVFTAVCGFEYHGPSGYIAFSPRITPEDFRAAFTSAAGWGTFAQRRSDSEQSETLDVRWGELRVATLAFELPSDVSVESVTVETQDAKLDIEFKQTENRVTISLREPVVLAAGQQLRVNTQFAPGAAAAQRNRPSAVLTAAYVAGQSEAVVPASQDEAGAGQLSAVPAAAYVVSKSGDGKFLARSSAGAVVASGTDASTVIQAAIDRLPVTGGKVYVAAGSYELTRTLKIEDKHGVHLEGAARGILFSGGKEGTSLRSTKPIDLLHIHGGEIKMAGVTVTNLHLVGSGKDNGKAGILITGNSDLLSLHQVGANNCGVGFHFKGGGPGAGVIDAPQIQFCDPQVNGIGLKIEHSHYAKVVGGEFSDCDQYGIVISSSDPGHRRSGGVKVIGVTAVRNGDGGILIGSNADCITITGGCDFGGSPRGSGVIVTNDQGGSDPHNVIITSVHAYNNKQAGIHIRQGEQVIVSQCICSGHDHVAVHNHGQPHGIQVDPEATGVVVEGNLISETGTRSAE